MSQTKKKVDITAYLVIPNEDSPEEFVVAKLGTDDGIEIKTSYRVRNGICTCPGASYRNGGEYSCRHVRMVYDRSKVVKPGVAQKAAWKALRWLFCLCDSEGKRLFEKVLFEKYKKVRGRIVGVQVSAHGKPLQIGDQTHTQFKVVSSGVEIDVEIRK